MRKPRKKTRNSTDRAKRRAVSQKIGRIGELIFEKWATEHGLNAHKCREDLGIDYFCERLRAVTARVEEVTGDVLLVQVRATSRPNRQCVTLARTDIVTALRAKQPFCLVAVSLETEQVWFRFLDRALFDDWTAFLRSKRKFLTHYLTHMQQDAADFAVAFTSVSRPAFRSILEGLKARSQLEIALPDAAFEVRGGPEGWTLVTVPQLTSIFHLDGKQSRAQATEIFFTPESLDASFTAALRQLPLHLPLQEIQGLALGPMVVVGEGETAVRLFVEWQSARVEADFCLRRVQDHRAYISSSGLVLEITDSRKDPRTGQHYHGLRATLQRAGSVDLDACGQLAFLKCLQPGATLNEVGKPGIEVEKFRLQSIGAAVTALERVIATLRLPLSAARLTDLTQQDAGAKLGFLDAILDEKSTAPLIPPFTIGLPNSHVVGVQNWRAGTYRVPIALNFAGRGVIVWILGEADTYIHQGVIHGFRFHSAHLERTETLSDEHANLTAPIEAWIYDQWPAIPLINRRARKFKAKKNGTLPFAGEFRFGAEPLPGEPAPTTPGHAAPD
jgi:hypothetical protein